jgi:hypothetical protein
MAKLNPNLQRVLYVTSFSPDLYAGTGKKLLESFYAQQQLPGRMLVCYEDTPTTSLAAGIKEFSQAEWLSLNEDPFLLEWLSKNKDIIPTYLGGLAEPCKCPNSKERHAIHKHRCYYQWMNRNASRWFRKVVAWRRAVRMPDVDYVIWLDSDCLVKQAPSYDFLTNLLTDRALVYMRGKRGAVESGILGLNLNAGGDKFIQEVCSWYTSGRFRKLPRWDDGYVVTHTINTTKKLNLRDVVNKQKQLTNSVVVCSPWAPYFTHNKGSHGTVLNIMK